MNSKSALINRLLAYRATLDEYQQITKDTVLLVMDLLLPWADDDATPEEFSELTDGIRIALGLIEAAAFPKE